jgi:hypothetical protein
MFVTMFTPQNATAFYSPNTGRWLSRDPINEKGGRNLYGFLNNDAVDYLDKIGLQCCLITYPPGNYGGTPPAFPSHWSPQGHSTLSCDNGAYVSFAPQEHGDYTTQWRTNGFDALEYANGPTPKKVCFGDCVNQDAVMAWLQTAMVAGNRWTWGNNCADATAAAVAAGLPSPQITPKCPCSFHPKERWVVTDLLNSGAAITLPLSASDRMARLVANGCQRYKCILQSYSGVTISY